MGICLVTLFGPFMNQKELEMFLYKLIYSNEK